MKMRSEFEKLTVKRVTQAGIQWKISEKAKMYDNTVPTIAQGKKFL